MTTYKLTIAAIMAFSSIGLISRTLEDPEFIKTPISIVKSDSLLRHVVLFKFKEGTPDTKISEIASAFSALPAKIPEVHAYEWGTNNSPENLAKGFTHCFFVTFESEADRAIYLPHPEHLTFVKLLEPHLEDVLVVDYWSRQE